jgi:uncharacterized protein (UPF0248 family)
MRSAKDILDMLRWREGYGLEGAEVWYLHRGAPDDTIVVKGSEISSLGRSFFSTGESEIPYHRVFKVVLRGRVIFERPKRRALPARLRRPRPRKRT